MPLDLQPNPWKAGDRVRVRTGSDVPERLRGLVGTVTGADFWSLGPNDCNTSIALDDDHFDGTPILNDRLLEALGEITEP